MKTRIHSLILLVCLLCAALIPVRAEGLPDPIDYAARAELNMASASAKASVTVKTFIDGDTTHFDIHSQDFPDGVIRARYLAINTPETTGKIEEYGKKASNFTREKLSTAVSIIVESDDEYWHTDSTSDRHLVWVWYQPHEGAPYRNLNIELLQEGLALANSAARNKYGSICTAAHTQAREQKLNIYSGQKDPDFYYGSAIELTLKELRTAPGSYNGMKVAFSGIITMNSANSIHIESYDPETDLYYGISVYYGHGLSGAGLDVLSVGNEARIVGTMQYYEAGGVWQVSGLTYRMMRPKDPGNIQKLSEGHSPSWKLTDPDTFAHGIVRIAGEESVAEYPYAELAMSTSVEMRNLLVVDTLTDVDEDSTSPGGVTLLCQSEGADINIRIPAMYDGTSGDLIAPDTWIGKTISVRGIVTQYDGAYQVRVFTADGITILN